MEMLRPSLLHAIPALQWLSIVSVTFRNALLLDVLYIFTIIFTIEEKVVIVCANCRRSDSARCCHRTTLHASTMDVLGQCVAKATTAKLGIRLF